MRPRRDPIAHEARLHEGERERLAGLFSGRKREAEAFYREALALLQACPWATGEERAQALANLAALLHETNGDAEALQLMEQAVEAHKQALPLWRQELGEGSSETAGSLNWIGWGLYCLGRYEEALGYFEQAVQRASLLHDLDPSPRQTYYSNLLDCRSRLGHSGD